MIVNSFVVSYLVITLLSLGVIVPAAGVAVVTGLRWRGEMASEEQGRLEQRVYLVISLLWLGFFVRLVMIPLWFVTLQSLVDAVPGAMCLAGVHLLDLPFSYWGTVLKLLVAFAYLYWLVLDGADRRSPTQPFMRRKLFLLVPLALLTVSESVLDLHFLARVRPEVVRCCTSIFDVPKVGVFKWIRHSADLFVPLFVGGLGATLCASIFVRPTSHRVARIVAALAAGLTLTSLVLALHTRMAPLMLEAPFHQCAFCLWQAFPDVTVASALAATGLWLTVACALLPRLDDHPASARFVTRLWWLAVVLYVAGTLEIVVRYVGAG